MKTEVILKRPFMGSEVRQKSKSEMFSATDLVKIGNSKRQEIGKGLFNLSAFLKNNSTIEFIEELQKTNEKVITKGRGKGAVTWVHPLLFIDIALSINPKFKVEVYQWLYDELVKSRNDSGNSYKLMTGNLFESSTDKTNFHKYITRVANYIKKECQVEDWNNATEKQLKLRNKMHENISILASVMRNPNEAVRLGVLKTKELNI